MAENAKTTQERIANALETIASKLFILPFVLTVWGIVGLLAARWFGTHG